MGTSRTFHISTQQNRFFSKKSSNKTEVEIIEPVTMELYIKAGPEDGQVGDCPFAHYVRLKVEQFLNSLKKLILNHHSKLTTWIRQLKSNQPFFQLWLNWSNQRNHRLI